MALIPFSNSSSTLNYVVWSSEHNHGGGKPVKDCVFVSEHYWLLLNDEGCKPLSVLHPEYGSWLPGAKPANMTTSYTANRAN